MDRPMGIRTAPITSAGTPISRLLVISTRACASIRAGRTRKLDLGQAGDKLFSLMLGVGLDAEVVRRVAGWRQSGNAKP